MRIRWEILVFGEQFGFHFAEMLKSKKNVWKSEKKAFVKKILATIYLVGRDFFLICTNLWNRCVQKK